MNFLAVSIDDEVTNLKLIVALAAELDLKVESFTNPEEALDFIKYKSIDLIFIDYMMPDMDGIAFIKEVRKHKTSIPIIMITAVHGDSELKLKALNSGATEFLNKPIDVAEFNARVLNLLELKKAHNLINNKALLLEEEVTKATQTILERENETLDILGKVSEYKDLETGAHIARVAYYAKLLAASINLDAKKQDLLFKAAPLHDIGKIGIPDHILTKKGKLEVDEYKTMRMHPGIGYKILKTTKSEYLQAGSIVSLYHHEKYDGSGYPNALKGKDIHIYGRIIAVCDVFDALSSVRPYKDAWPFDDVLQYMRDESGKHFDPELIEHFMSNLDEIKTIFDSFR